MKAYWPSQDRFNQIIHIALPIMAGMISQSVLNLVDIWMVGHLGSAALAAVGMASNANFLAAAAVMGLGAGVQAMVARRKGEDNQQVMALPLNAGLVIALIMSAPLFSVFYFGASPIMHALLPDETVSILASDYFAVRVAGIFAVGMNFCFRGYWNGINRSKVYMRTLITMHISNVLLSYGLIFGKFGLPELGVYGAGLGTTLSLYIATILYFVQCWLLSRPHGFLISLPDLQLIQTTLKLALPNSIQQVFFASGITALFWILGQVGTNELAIGHVLITIILFLILPPMGLGMASTSLVSQSLGRRNAEDAFLWGANISLLGMSFLWLVGFPLFLFPDFVLGLFVQEPELINVGRVPLQITAVFIGLDAVGIILSQALLGAGASKTVMKVSILLQWGFFIPCAYIIGPVLGYGLIGIWLFQLLQRLMQAIIMGNLWRKRSWASIEI